MSPSLSTGKPGAAPAKPTVIQVRAHTRAAPVKATALNTETVRPAQVSPAKRFVPNYVGEPIAGHVQGLQNPDRSWVKPGGKFQPGAHLALRPYYTDKFTTHHGAGPSGQESTQWNAAQVAAAHAMQLKNFGLPGFILRSALPGGLNEDPSSVGTAVKRGADIGSWLVPGGAEAGAAVKAAGIFGLGGKVFRGIKAAEGAAEAAGAASPVRSVLISSIRASHPLDQPHHEAGIWRAMNEFRAGKSYPITIDEHGHVVDGNQRLEAAKRLGLTHINVIYDVPGGVTQVGGHWVPEGGGRWVPNAAAPKAIHATEGAAAVRAGLKGAPAVRAVQTPGFSSQRAARFAKAETIYRDTSLTPEERELLARAALKGRLERPVFTGFKNLDPESVTNLKSQIMVHNSLRTGQKTTLLESLSRAVTGIVPTAGEQKLFEQVFGKDVAGGILRNAKSGRWKNIAVNVLNTPRTIQAALDLSAFLRQGFVALGRHPLITSKNFVPMVKAFGSEGYTRAVEHQIETHPDFPLMQVGKVALTGGGALSPHEEQFAAHMLEALGGAKNPIRWSSRAYSTFLNKTRADIFNHMLEVARGQGINVHDEQWLKDLGEMVNVFTGRGGLPGGLERAANVFNGLFFSPRLMASRIKALTQPFNVALARRNPFVYKQYVRAALQSAGGLFTILALAKLNGLNVGTNPRSADFGKIRLGNTSVDLGAGFLQYFHLLGEVITREYKSSAGGKVSKLGGGPGHRSVYDVLNDFMSGKLSPPFAAGVDVAKQQTNFGPFDPTKEAVSKLTPLSWQDIYDIYKQHGGGPGRIPPAAAGGLLSIFGGGIQTYPRTPKGGSSGSSGGGDPYDIGGSGGGSGDPYDTGGSGGGSGDPYNTP
jgi:hypothetical protein